MTIVFILKNIACFFILHNYSDARYVLGMYGMKTPGLCTLILLSSSLSSVVCQQWPCRVCEAAESHFPMCGLNNERGECKIMEAAKILHLEQILHKNINIVASFSGMHMEIETTSEFTISDIDVAEKIAEDCILLHIQDVPSSFFIDRYEVERLGNTDFLVHFNRNIDVEKPQYQAPNASILLYTTMHHSTNSGILTARSTLPWHSRYHRPSTDRDKNQTHTHATVEAPTVWLSCNANGAEASCNKPCCQGHDCDMNEETILAPCVSKTESSVEKIGKLCFWYPLLLDAHEQVIVPIPIGQYSQSRFVLWTTIAITLLSTAIICIVAALHTGVEISLNAGKSIDHVQ